MLNFGTGGYNTSQEYLTLQKDVLACSPDIVLLTLFAGNDIEANWRKPKEESPAYCVLRLHRIEDGELISIPSPPFTVTEAALPSSALLQVN